MTPPRFKEFRNQVCECDHGAGWHGGVLASFAWKEGKQTELHCEHDDCKCTGFRLNRTTESTTSD